MQWSLTALYDSKATIVLLKVAIFPVLDVGVIKTPDEPHPVVALDLQNKHASNDN